MATRVLVVLDGTYRFADSTGGTTDFTYTALVNALTGAGFDVTRAHRESDATPGVLTAFDFAGPGVNLLEHDVIWLIGNRGRNVAGSSGTFDLGEDELAAITRFMDAGGGVFATGDHDSIGSDLCGRIPRVRAARCWYGEGDNHSPMPAGFPRNFPPTSTERADTTQPSAGSDYSEFAPPFVWFENQSDSVPQPIEPATTPAHPILHRDGRDIVIYPDHMHEGQTLGDVGGDYDYGLTLTFSGQNFVEFPSVDGDQPRPEVIATGQVLEHAIRVAASGGGSDTAIAAAKSVNTLSAYDGRRAGVGRVVTGSTFHHYVDINLTGDSDIVPGPAQTRVGADAAKGHGFAHPGAEATFADIQAVFVNITHWLARPRPAIGLILERSTFGQDEVTVNPQFDAAFLVTVDGLKPADFPGGGITTLSPSQLQLDTWAPQIDLGSAAIEVRPTAVSSDSPSLPALLQRFTFTYRVRFVADAFGFGGQQQLLTANAALSTPAAPAPLTDAAAVQLVKSANPFMLDLANGNTTHWLSSDLKVFPVVAGASLHGVSLPNGATRAQALDFIRDLVDSLSVAQFDQLAGGQSASALSPFPTTSGGQNVYNFAIARVRRNGTMVAASDVRVFFRIFSAQTTAALTYTEAGGAPVEGYLRTAGADPIALPGQAGGQWLSFPCFAASRTAAPEDQTDPDNVKDISTAQSDRFFGVLLDNNLGGAYLPPTPGAGAAVPLPDLLMGEHQCLVAQIEFAGTPIPSGARPSTSDKLAQRNIALSEVANPGQAASRVAMHTFEIEASPQPIGDASPPDELLLQWSRTVPPNTHATIHIPSWKAADVVALADRFYARHELRAVDEHTIELPAGGMRYVPIPRSLRRQNGVLAAELPLGIKKGQRFDVSVRQVSNRSRRVRVPPSTVTPISREEAVKRLAQIKKHEVEPAAKALPRGVFDLGDNLSLVTDLSVLDDAGDHALLVQHPDPKDVAAARRASLAWRETVGAFQLGIPVSTKDEMLVHHLRLLSVMSWRAAHLSRRSRWYASFKRYVEMLADKVRALGGDPFTVPATPDGAIPPLRGEPGNPPGHDGGGCDVADDGDDGKASPAATGKVSALVFDHFGDFEGFVLESADGVLRRYASREATIRELADAAWRERHTVTVQTWAGDGRRVRRLLVGGSAR